MRGKMLRRNEGNVSILDLSYYMELIFCSSSSYFADMNKWLKPLRSWPEFDQLVKTQ